MSQVVLVYDPSPRTRAQRASGLMDHTVSVREYCGWLTLYVGDEAADFPSPSPFPLRGPRPVALVDLDTDDTTVCAAEAVRSVRPLVRPANTVHAVGARASAVCTGDAHTDANVMVLRYAALLWRTARRAYVVHVHRLRGEGEQLQRREGRGRRIGVRSPAGPAAPN